MRGWLPAALALLAVAWLVSCAGESTDSAPVVSTEPPAQGTGEPPPYPTEGAKPASTSSRPAVTPRPQTAEPTYAPPAPSDASPAVSTTGLLRLTDFLDDPGGYCIDVPGFGENLRLDGQLQAHTCKPRSDDQLFSLPDGGGVRLERHGRCLTASRVVPGSGVGVVQCDATASTQDFQMDSDGSIRFSADDGTTLCLGVADGTGEPAGGRNHLRRDLILYDCDGVESRLTVWELVKQ